jgi:sugar phosphate permease
LKKVMEEDKLKGVSTKGNWTIIHYGWVILFFGTLVVFGSLGLARFGFSVLLPEMQKNLQMDNVQAGIMATSNLVGYLTLSVVGGALAARFGPRVVITTGLLTVGITLILTGISNTFFTATIWRTLTGIGSGASNVPIIGLLSTWFTPRRRGLAAGVVVTGSSLGLIFTGPIVPWVISEYSTDGWRICWYLFGGLTFLIAVAGGFIIRNRPSQMGLQPVGPHAGYSLDGPGAQALRWGDVYKSPTLWHLGIVYMAFGFSYIIYMTFFVKYLISEGGYSPQSAGNLFMIMGWCSLFCGVIWGSLSDLIGRRFALVSVYCIHGVSFSFFAVWPVPMGFIVSAVLFGFSAWSIPAIMAATCGDVFGPRMAPAALGFITLLFGISQAFGPSVAGAMAESAGSFSSAFILASVVAFTGAVASWLLCSKSIAAKKF